MFLNMLLERVEIEKECLLRELENSSEMDMIRYLFQSFDSLF